MLLLPILASAIALSSCGTRLYRETRPAMSTTLSVLVSGRRQPDWRALFAFADREARLFDHRYPDTPIGRLNRTGSGSPPPEVLQVLHLARRIAAASGGAFDPTILPLTSLWDFDGGGKLPTAEQLQAAGRRVDYTRMEIDSDGTVRLPAGFGLDLGGIAKGAVVDRLADRLAEEGYAGFLIDAGGDILISGLKQGKSQWRIAIRHPRKSEALIGVLSLGAAGQRRAVVTSGDYERYFIAGGKRYHHILDPHTGFPASGLASVTVIAPSCTLADALSTAVFVLGPREGLALLENWPGSEGLLIAEQEGTLRAWRTNGFPLAPEELELQ